MMTDTTETPFFFERDRHRLFGILHAAQGQLRGAFVFCHPFAEEKLWAHRTYVSFAREVAARGYAVLRFDMTGHGDSDGQFARADVDTYLADVRRAVDEVASRVPTGTPLGLLGLRLGAALAAQAADNDPRIANLILWEPVTDGAKYGQEVLMANLAMQMAAYGKVMVERKDLVKKMESGETVNVDGYDVSHAMFQQISAIRLDQQVGQFRGRCLVVQVDRAERPLRKELQALAARYAQATIAPAIEQPFWKEIKEFYGKAPRLAATTLDWLMNPSAQVSAGGESQA